VSAERAYLTEPQKLDAQGFTEVFFKVGDGVYLSGQPSAEGLARAKAMGVKRVINLRTDREVNDRNIVPYDEAEAVAELGIDYVRIPQGGPDTPYAPQAVEQLDAAIASSSGPVLLHCTVAWRATHLWTAWLIEKQGVEFDEAIRIGKRLNFGGMPLEGFLGRELTIAPVAGTGGEHE
jgi:uncharacterized protein (TIGR01244 family)